MKVSFFCFALLFLLLDGGCLFKHDTQPAISNEDILMQSNGYWQWESSGTRGTQLTPTSVGFSRELIFENDGLVHIFHNRQPAVQPAYQLSSGVLSQCNQQTAVPLVRYTAEPKIPNNDLRTYSIRLSSTDTTLSITGAAACTDAGYNELYRWHRH